MHIKKPQHSTPSVMGCPMLQIVEGCAHGKCHFCDIFNGIPFKVSPLEEIQEDIDEIAAFIRSDQRRINLTGGNPYALSADKLITITDIVKEKIPTVTSFGGFCRIADIKSKSDEDLRRLAAAGINDLSIGAESGYDPALEFMEKGHTALDVAEQGKRLNAAGIDFTYFYLVGMAGAGKGQENAIATAKAFSEAAPGHVLIVCMTPTQTWPLAQDIEAGLWKAPTEIEMIEEIRTFIEHLDCETYINCSHDTDIIKFEGLVFKDQENMLKLIDNRLPQINPKAARKMREMLHKATF